MTFVVPGLKALHPATQAIQCGEADIVIIAGGQGEYEPCAACPHEAVLGALPDADNLVDSLDDGLWDAFNDYHIGVTAENPAREYGISRELQDAYALSSQQKPWLRLDTGRFKDEINPIVTQRGPGRPQLSIR